LTNFDSILTYKFSAFATQNNSALGIEVNAEAYLCTLLRSLKKFGCLTLGMIYW